MNQFIREQDPSYLKQFKDALLFGPCINEDEVVKEKTTMETVIHFFTYPWKVLFAVLLPPKKYSAWFTFSAGYIIMGFLSFAVYSIIVTAGCILNLHNTVLAMTIIALGTSMPDFWCTMVTAKRSKTADASLLNIMAANAANIFLGLGLPWTIMCIYRWSNDTGANEAYPYTIGKYETAEITFVMVVFMMCSIITLIILLMRRLTIGGEIGGSHTSRSVSACILLCVWLIFVLLASLHSIGSLGPYKVFEPELGIKALQLHKMPGRPDPPVALSEVDHISLTWWLPIHQRENIDKCMVKVRLPDGNFREIKKYCDCSDRTIFEEAKCHIPHYYLHNDYGFEACSEIYVKVRYHNKNGWGDWSSLNDEPAKVHGCPQTPSFSSGAVTASNAILSWKEPDNGCSPISAYSLEMKKEREPFKDLLDDSDEFTGLEYTVQHLQCDTHYSFRGRANNPVCASKYSANIDIRTARCPMKLTEEREGTEQRQSLQLDGVTKVRKQLLVDELDFELPVEVEHPIDNFEVRTSGDPFANEELFDDDDYEVEVDIGSQMAPVITSNIDPCQVKVEWEPFRPKGFESVQGQIYRIQVASATGDWFDLPKCPDPLDLSPDRNNCAVPMEVFAKEPFSLDQDDIILARGRTENTLGHDKWSEPGPLLTAARFKKGPTKRLILFTTNHDLESITLSWASKHLNLDENISYELQQSLDPESGFETVVALKNELLHRMKNLLQSQYFFRVRAADSCGNGPWSEIFLVVPADLDNTPEYAVDKKFSHLVDAMDNDNQNSLLSSEGISMVENGEPILDFAESAAEKPKRMTLVEHSKSEGSRFPQFNSKGFGNTEVPTNLFAQHGHSMSRNPRSFRVGLEERKPTQNTILASVNAVPGPPDELQTELGACRLMITWSEPRNIGGFEIHRSRIEIQGKDNMYYEVACQSEMSFECSISVVILTKSPFNLHQNDPIVVRVQVKGEVHWGKYATNSQTRVMLGPGAITNLRAVHIMAKQITLEWDEIRSVDGAPLDYLVYWDEGWHSTANDLANRMEKFSQVSERRVTENTITIPVLKRATYRFFVRGRNNCGTGSPSQVIKVPVSVSLPKQMAPVVTENISGCRIKLSWAPPRDDGGSEIIAYELSVRGRDQEFHPIDQLCGENIGTQTSCTVSSESLQAAPYDLRLGDRVEVTGAAETIQGFGPASLISSENARLKALPPNILMPPEKTFYTANSVTIGWDESFTTTDPTNMYELYVDNGMKTHPMLLIETKLTKYTYMIHQPGLHKFYVRARNSCGAGAYSPALRLQLSISSVPQRMKPVAVVAENCGVRISWEPPVDGGSPIFLYIVKVRGSDGKYHSLSNICGNGPHQKECTVPMQTLAVAPFALETGDLIEVTAQAVNALGTGEEVSQHDGANVARMINFMPTIEGLELTRMGNQLKLSWDDAFGAVADEQSQKFYYEILWDNKGNPPHLHYPGAQYQPESTLLESCHDCDHPPTNVWEGRERTIKPYLLLKSVPSLSRTRFQVRAVTPCATGPFSKTIHEHQLFNQNSEPKKMQTMQVDTGNCRVNIKWTAPQDGGYPIKRYVIKVKDSRGYLHRLNCDKETSGYSQICTVPMKILADSPFNLVEGSPIIAVGQAVNSLGKGPRSPENDPNNGPWMGKRPPPISGLQSIVNQDSVILKWEDVFPISKRRYYVIEWDEGKGGRFVRKSERKKASITVYNLKKGHYRFRVKAHNLCGSGPFSNVRSIHFAGAEILPEFDSSGSESGSGFPVDPHPVVPTQPETRPRDPHPIDPHPVLPDTTITVDPYPTLPDENIHTDPVPVLPDENIHVDLHPTEPEASDIGHIDNEPINPVDPLPLYPHEETGVDTSHVDPHPVVPDRVHPGGRVLPHSSRPAKMRPVVAVVEKCKVKIRWTKPDSGNIPIIGYALRLRGNNGKYYPLNCQQISMTCSVQLKDLKGEPYLLSEGAPIIVRAAARNSKGYGRYSNINKRSRAVMTGLPPAVGQPQEDRAKRTSNSVTIRWAPAFPVNSALDALQVYELFVDSGLGSGYTDVFYTTRTYFRVKNLKRTGIYKFKLRTRTSCDHGSYSEELRINFKGDDGIKPPGKIEVMIKKVKCSVLIQWTKPSKSLGSKILGYHVEVRGRDPPDYLPLKDLCQRSESGTSCEVRMSSLASGLFNLQRGDPISVRVRPYTAKSEGQWVKPDSNIRVGMLQVPKMGKIRGGIWTKDGISFNWESVIDKKESDSYYEIFWDVGGESDWKPLDTVLAGETVYVVEAADRRTDYNFKIKAYNQCGESDFSSILFVGKQRCPDQMEVISAKRINCDVEFSWKAPTQGESRIIEYDIQVQASDKQFRSISICRNRVLTQQCVVPISLLAGSPFYLEEGKAIVAQASAKNAQCWSQLASPVSNTGVLMIPFSKPQKIMNPRGVFINPKTIQLTWDESLPGLMYEILMFDNKENRWREVSHETKTNVFTYKDTRLRRGQVYQFRILAYSQCGSRGAASDVVPMMLAAPPGQLEQVSVARREDACGVQIEWQPPTRDGGQKIISYNVELRVTSDDNESTAVFKSYMNCGGDPSITLCYIPMLELRSNPYNLGDYQSVIARVAAVNLQGQGDFSPYTTASERWARIETEPKQMERPRHKSLLDEDEPGMIQLLWDQPPDTDSPIEEYEVLWNQGIRSAHASALYKVTDELSMKIEDVDPAKQYKFAVQAVSKCGTSTPSAELIVSPKTGPKKMKAPEVSIFDCKVKIKWVKPPAEEEVKNFTIFIEGNDAKFHPLDHKLCGAEPKRTFCHIDMSHLVESPFLLSEGEQIVAYIVATNPYAQSEPSNYKRDIAPYIMGLPSQLERPQLINKVGKEIELSWEDAPDEYSYQLWFVNERNNGKFQRVIESTKKKTLKTKLDRPGIYWFKLRALSECGFGKFSEVLSFYLSIEPEQVKGVAIEQEYDCTMKVKWQAPFDGGSAITRYIVEFATLKDGFERQFNSTNIGCGRNHNSTECDIDIQVLIDRPYNYVPSDDVHVRVRAVNEVGMGPPSREATLSTRFKSVPAAMKLPQYKIIPDGKPSKHPQVRILWNSPGDVRDLDSKVVKTYDLVWDHGLGAPVNKRVVDTIATFHTVNNLKPPNVYQFAIRAHNECGYGHFSPTLPISLRWKPERMEMIRTSQSQEGCGIRFSWVGPESYGLEIREYQIRIKNPVTQEFVILEACKQNAMDPTFCEVGMFTLEGPKYQLRKDDLIQVMGRAITEDANGQQMEGQWSPVNQKGARLASRPEKMTQVYKLNDTTTSLELQWANSTLVSSGGRKITAYNLFWNAGLEEGVHQQLLYDLPKNNAYNVTGLPPGTLYKFKIRARNACGFGDWSPITQLTTAFCPTAPDEPPVVSLKGTNVTIEWKKPIINKKRNDKPITGYKVEFLKRDGTFISVKECNEEALVKHVTKTITEWVIKVHPRNPKRKKRVKRTRKVKGIAEVKNSCQVPMLKIGSYTGLEVNDLIQVRVRATNKYCEGKWSPINDAGQVVLTCPKRMQPMKYEDADVSKNQIKLTYDTLFHQEAGGTGVAIKFFEIQYKNEKGKKTTTSKPTILMQFTHTDLKNNEWYLYRIRANNEFCPGQWSAWTRVLTGEIPNTPLPPVTEIVPIQYQNGELPPDPDAHVQIKWKAPLNPSGNAAAIERYNLYIGTKNQKEFLFSEYCNRTKTPGSIITSTDPKTKKTVKSQFITCFVKMESFWEGTFKKGLGTRIVAIVNACNKIGCSANSTQTQDGKFAEVQTGPGEIKELTAYRIKTNNYVRLKWTPIDDEREESGDSRITAQQLQYRTVPKNMDKKKIPWKDISQFKASKINYNQDLKGLLGPVEYRIKARNRWGWGNYSNVTALSEVHPPEQIPTPKQYIGTGDGALVVDWQEPQLHGLELTDIKLEIYNDQDKPIISKECSIKSVQKRKEYQSSNNAFQDRLFCAVQMQTLQEKFGLEFDRMIYLRVAATTYAGTSPWSEKTKVGQRVRMKPSRMVRPEMIQIAENQSQNLIKVSWKALLGREKTGNSLILEYVLWQQVDTFEAEEKYRGSATSYMVFDLEQGKTYRFFVTAVNVYGEGEESDELIIETGSKPATMEPIRSHNEEKGRLIHITWAQPDHNGSPIKAYTVQIWNKKKREYVEDKSVCDGSSQKVIWKRQCEITSQKAMDAFGYSPGDLFRVIVRAENEWGPGNWSRPNIAEKGYKVATVFVLEKAFPNRKRKSKRSRRRSARST